jgi:hypothetical protein
MEVGIEDCLHIEFEYNKSKYHLKDVIVGKIYFLLVRIKIKHMELAIVKRESTGSGANVYHETENVTKYEIMVRAHLDCDVHRERFAGLEQKGVQGVQIVCVFVLCVLCACACAGVCAARQSNSHTTRIYTIRFAVSPLSYRTRSPVCGHRCSLSSSPPPSPVTQDGAPVRGESIPIRLFLAGFELSPTLRDVHKKFSVRYYLNLVLIDEEDRRYFKQQEVVLWRKGPSKKSMADVQKVADMTKKM